jgi:DNA primase
LRLNSSQRRSLELATSEYETYLELALTYLNARGITKEHARAFRLGFVADPLPGHEMYAERLSIPYVTKAGIAGLRFRCLEDHVCKDEGCPKYLGLDGTPTALYNVNAFFEAGNFIAICEGELDALVLHSAGVPAVGVPGVSNWKDHHPRCFAGFDPIYIFADNDSAGRDFAKRLRHDLEGAVIVNLPEGSDVNETFLAEGREGLLKRAGLA